MELEQLRSRIGILNGELITLKNKGIMDDTPDQSYGGKRVEGVRWQVSTNT